MSKYLRLEINFEPWNDKSGGDLLKIPPLELLTDDGLNTLLLVESIPELGNDGEFLALHEAFIDGTLDANTSLFLITIV